MPTSSTQGVTASPPLSSGERSAPAFWTSLPFAQFKRDPRFYVKYDAVYGLLAIGVIAALVTAGYEAPRWESWMAVLLVPATYLTILAHVFIHNASHGNFPKAVNRIVGEICGVVVWTKFASWEIVHRRHHRYSDDATRDPHPAEPGYWRYAGNTLINVEKQLQQQYLDCFGDTAANRSYERIRSFGSFVSGALIAAVWFVLLGPGLFAFVYFPAFVLAALFVVHFNWVGHNAHVPGAKIQPANLDTGWYWIGNRIFFGIYYHGNHHKMARVFNPMYMPTRTEAAESAEAA